MQYAVGVSEKGHMGGGDHYPLVQKGQTPHAVSTWYAVSTQYTVGISAKRSTGTVELANMGGGDCYPLVQKGQTPPCSWYTGCSGHTVRSRY